jgi:hypothetical protein
MSIPRSDQRQCAPPEKGGCGYWKHHSRFHLKTGKGSVARFSPFCRDCETKHRNERKNQDRALEIMKRRARDHAEKYKVTFDFMWNDMGWKTLVPILRALITDEALCTSCIHSFDNERDVQLDHNEPPRRLDDYARLHARNITIRCASCNSGKSDKDYAQWLDEQEQSRLSNEASPSPSLVREPNPGPLFEWSPKP